MLFEEFFEFYFFLNELSSICSLPTEFVLFSVEKLSELTKFSLNLSYLPDSYLFKSVRKCNSGFRKLKLVRKEYFLVRISLEECHSVYFD